MGRRLTNHQIETACVTLLARQRRVGVRDVMLFLETQHGGKGRTQRVADILRTIGTSQLPSPSPAAGTSDELEILRQQLLATEARAERAEELERHHQDYWADRYAQKAAEIEKRYAALIPSASVVPAEQYLRLYQRAAGLARRLARYEPVEAAEGPEPPASHLSS